MAFSEVFFGSRKLKRTEVFVCEEIIITTSSDRNY